LVFLNIANTVYVNYEESKKEAKSNEEYENVENCKIFFPDFVLLN